MFYTHKLNNVPYDWLNIYSIKDIETDTYYSYPKKERDEIMNKIIHYLKFNEIKTKENLMKFLMDNYKEKIPTNFKWDKYRNFNFIILLNEKEYFDKFIEIISKIKKKIQLENLN